MDPLLFTELEYVRSFLKLVFLTCLMWMWCEICIFFEYLDFYMHKYAFFYGNVQIRLAHLIPFKHRLNRLNSKQRVTNRLAFRITLPSANFCFIIWKPSSLSWAKTILSYRLDSAEIAFRFPYSTISNRSFLKSSQKVSLYDSTVKQLQWTLRLSASATTLAFPGW
jgi:hypothetical protein